MTKNEAIAIISTERFPQQARKIVEKGYCIPRICRGYCSERKCERCFIEIMLEQKENKVNS